jgi:hypothetical protein
MKTKTAKQVWLNGKPSDLTIKNVVEIVTNLYRKNLAEAWFIGTGWVEGFRYCQDFVYLEQTGAGGLLKNSTRAVWFACTFLD